MTMPLEAGMTDFVFGFEYTPATDVKKGRRNVQSAPHQWTLSREYSLNVVAQVSKNNALSLFVPYKMLGISTPDFDKERSGIGDIIIANRDMISLEPNTDPKDGAAWLQIGLSIPTGDEETALPASGGIPPQATRLGTGTIDPILTLGITTPKATAYISYRYSGGYNENSYRTGDVLSAGVGFHYMDRKGGFVELLFQSTDKRADRFEGDRVPSTAFDEVDAILRISKTMGDTTFFASFNYPLLQDVSGVQLTRDYSVMAGIIFESRSPEKEKEKKEGDSKKD